MRFTLYGLTGLAAVLLAAWPASAQQPGGAGGQGGLAPLQPAVGPYITGQFQAQPFQLDPQQMQEKMRAEMARALGVKLPPPALSWGGMTLEPAGEALLEQLNLPAGQGMVVASIDEDSAAAKAGLKKNDLVLKVNQEAVPGDARSLLKALGKSDAPLELVVLRKGKEQTLKAVKLPEAAMAGPGPGPALPGGFAPGGLAPGAFPPPIARIAPGAPGGFGRLPIPQLDLGSKFSLNREDDKFTADYEKDKVKITVRGKIENKEAKAEEITMKEGETTKKFEKVKDLPEAYREPIEQILRMVSGDPGAVVPGIRGLPNLQLRPLPPPPQPAVPPDGK